jgi:hypothetical protein
LNSRLLEEDNQNELQTAEGIANIEELYRQLKQNYEDRRDFAIAGEFHFSEKLMKTKRLKLSGFKYSFLLRVCRILSGYNERIMLPLIWLLGVTFLFSGFYLCTGLQLKDRMHINITHKEYVSWDKWHYAQFASPKERIPKDSTSKFLPSILAGEYHLYALSVNQYLTDKNEVKEHPCHCGKIENFSIAFGYSINKFMPFKEPVFQPVGITGSILSFIHQLIAPLLLFMMGAAIRQRIKR